MNENDRFHQRRWSRPDDATEFLLVRHGASAPFAPGQLFPLRDGHGDPALAPEGRAQARQVARRLEAEPLDALYVTTLARTRETAQPLADATGVDLAVEPGLREVFLGEWEGGLFRQRLAEGHPSALAVYAEQRWDAIPGGETNDGFVARCVDAIERLANRHRGGLVACVVHGGVIGALAGHAVGTGPFSLGPVDNASITQIVVFPDRWTLVTFNDSSHVFAHFDTTRSTPAG